MDDDGSATLRSSQRARLTCSECYRRKIKCDKNVPCGTCIKRGMYSTDSSPDSDISPTKDNQLDDNLVVFAYFEDHHPLYYYYYVAFPNIMLIVRLFRRYC